MGMRDAAASPNAWLGFVTTQLKEHDNSWPKSLDSDDGLSESEKALRDRLRAKWQSQRDLYAQDVKLAAESVGLVVDVRGYPMLPEPVKEEPRNGFLSPEDATRLREMLSPSSHIPALSSPAVDDDGESRFRQVTVIGSKVFEDKSTETHLLGLGLDGRVWIGVISFDADTLRWWQVSGGREE